MATINRIPLTIVGNIGRMEYRRNRNGDLYANFSVAQTERIQRDGRWEDGQTTWIRCVAGYELAEHMQASRIDKGTRVVVTGWYTQRDWVNDQGENRSTLELQAEEVSPSLRLATVNIHRVERDNGFAGRAPASTTPNPAQPTPAMYQNAGLDPADDPWANPPATPAI